MLNYTLVFLVKLLRFVKKTTAITAHSHSDPAFAGEESREYRDGILRRFTPQNDNFYK